MTTEEQLQTMQGEVNNMRLRMDTMSRALEIGFFLSFIGWALIIGFVYLRGAAPIMPEQKEQPLDIDSAVVIPSRIRLSQEHDSTSIVIANAKGIPCIAIGEEGGIAFIKAFDIQGNPRVVMDVNKAGSKLSMLDESGGRRLGLVAPNGAPAALAIHDEKCQFRAMLVAGIDGPMLTLLDSNMVGRATLGVIKDGPGLALQDENGQAKAELIAMTNSVVMNMCHEEGAGRVTLAADKLGASLYIQDENGNSIWRAP